MKYGFVVCLLLVVIINNAQIAVSGSTGANGVYTSLTNAGGVFATLNAAGSQAGNNISIQIAGSVTTETGTNSLNGNGWASLNIFPNNTAITVSGSALSGLIKFIGTTRVIINGFNVSGSSLTFENTNTAAHTIGFTNSCTNNIINNCTIKGGVTSTTSGVVLFGSSASGVGNNNNKLYNCEIAPTGSNTPTYGVYSNGATLYPNISDSIVKCNIYDYFRNTSSSAGVLVATNNQSWVIDSCRFYQTATRTTSSGTPIHSAINIANSIGDRFVISNNVIGGDNVTGTGYSNYGSTATTPFYKAIIVSNTGPISAAYPSSSKVFGNIIRGINVQSGATNTSAGNNIFVGIELANGTTTDSVICKNNVIGGRSGVDSILITATSTSANNPCVGIFNKSTRGNVIDSNIIGAIRFANNSGTRTTSFIGIKAEISSSSNTTQIRYNTIGNADVTNSISTTHEAGQIIGIQYGIASSTAINNIEKNSIQNFFTSTSNSGTGSTACIIGILGTPSNNDNTIVNGNSIANFRIVPLSGSPSIIGVRFTSQTGGVSVPGLLYNNTIKGFSLGSGATATSKLIGLQSAVGNNHYIYNNMVSMGNSSNPYEVYAYDCAASTVRLYNNTFVVTGFSGIQSAAFLRSTNNPFSAINNIFYNTIPGTNNSAVRFTSSLSTTFTYIGNYNIFQPSATSNTAYINSVVYTTLADFSTALASSSGNSEGLNSKAAPVTFVGATDLHTTDLDVIRAGQNLYTATPAITTDIDGQARSSTCLPSVGADEVYFNTVGNRHTWIGTTDFKWCEPCNWDKATVPNSSTSVYINAGASNYPSLNSSDGCSNTACDSITLNHNVTPLRLGIGSDLQVYGSVYYMPTGSFSTYLGGLLTLKGTGNEEFKTQSSGGSFGFSNVIVDRSDITTINDCILAVSTTITLTNGLLNLTNGTSVVTTAVIGGSNSSYIATPFANNYVRLFNLTTNANKLIPIGSSITSYNPLILNNQPANKRFDFTVNTGINPTVSFPLNAINRTWKIVPEAPVPSTPIDVTFQYSDVDANASCNPTATMELGGYTPSVWNIVSSPTQSTPIGTATDRQVSFPVTNWVNAYAIGNIGSILSVSNGIDLQVQKNNQGASLRWQINVANGIQNFEVQKSIDGIQFYTVYTLTNTQMLSYTYQDLFNQTNTAYYRIKANRLFGGALYSQVRLLTAQNTYSATLLPSLTNSYTTLYINNVSNKKATLTIINAAGKTVQQKQVNLTNGLQQIDIDATTLQSGLYFVRLNEVILKFVKQ